MRANASSVAPVSIIIATLRLLARVGCWRRKAGRVTIGTHSPSRSRKVAARPQSKGNPNTYSGRLGTVVRTRREALAISVEAFKDALEALDVTVTDHTVYHWEKGLRPIPLNAVPAIAKVLKLAIRDLLPAK